MLVLSRKEGEQIQIGDEIVLTVVRIDEGAVRLGIEAPPSAVIVRQELLGGQEPTVASRLQTGPPGPLPGS